MKNRNKNCFSLTSCRHLIAAQLIFIIVILAGTNAWSQQIRSGAAYLKILPGTRQQNMVGSLTGGLDGIYTVYANPGTAGLLRHWQFSASYNRWIAGIHNTSLFWGQQFRINTLLSDKLNFGLGLNAQNVGDFDATGGNNFVSAQDILLNLSLGMPLTKILPNISIGANIKYFRSELAQHSAATGAFDLGFLYRTSRKPFDFFFADHLIFSFGAALTQIQLGSPLAFISDETPLPKTFRVGAALNIGKHDAQQLQVAFDYRKVRDEKRQFGLGLEFINPFGRAPWIPELVIRGGHIFDDQRDERLINSISVGLSFRLDDYMTAFPYAQKGDHLLLKNAALRVDGGLLNSETFSNVYQGSITYQPIGPEPFQFVKSNFMSLDVQTKPEFPYHVGCDTIPLSWTAARDPDLYDQVNYLLLITKEDSTVLEPFIQMAKRNEILDTYLRDYNLAPDLIDSTEIRILHVLPTNGQSANGTTSSALANIVQGSRFFAHNKKQQLNYDLSIPCDAPGDYYWTVLAYDKNRHFRVIDGNIARFHVQPAPLFTLNIQKRPKQNVADVKITNVGKLDIDQEFLVRITAFDSTQVKSIVQKTLEEPTGELAGAGFYRLSDFTSQQVNIIDWRLSPAGNLIERKVITRLPAGQSSEFEININGDSPYVIAEIDSANLICANTRDTLALSDPSLEKTVAVEPFRPKVIFHPVGTYNLTPSAKQELQRLSQSFQSPLLKDVCIKIDGHTDEQGWRGRTREENIILNKELSLKRVTSVRDYLDSLGVDTTKIILEGYGQNKPRIPKVDSTFSRLQKTQRDSLHRMNRRVQMYLIRKKCDHTECSIETLSACSVDTLKTVNPGGQLRYVFKVKNESQFTAHNVEVSDLLPEHVHAATANNLTNGSRFHFSETIPLISPNSIKTIELTAFVEDSLPSRLFELANSATLQSVTDVNLANNTSGDTVYVLGGQPPNIEPLATNVTIVGIPRVSELLSGTYSYFDSDRDPEGASTFRWLRDGEVIPGATSQIYTLREADRGHIIRFEVTPVAQSGAPFGAAKTSAGVGPIGERPNSAPVATKTRITGVPEVGSTLQAHYEFFDTEGDLEGTSDFQWFRNEIAIPDATTATYELTDLDLGALIRFEVTPSAVSGTAQGASVLSPPVGPIKPANRPPVVEPVQITGFPEVGRVLKGTYVWHDPDGDLPGQEVFRWLRNGEPIPGANSDSYLLTNEDLGAVITFEVTPIALTGRKTGLPKQSEPTKKIRRYRPR